MANAEFRDDIAVEGEYGEPVVLLHSSGSSGSQWRTLADTLKYRHAVAAPDLYGYGASPPWGGNGSFSLAQEAAALVATLRRQSQPVHLVGHSYGGAVALHIARTHPELVRSLAVVEPVAFHLLRSGVAADEAALDEIIDITRAVVLALSCGDFLGGYGRFVDYWSGSGTWAAIPQAKRQALAPQLSKVALDFHATLHEPAVAEDFRQITTPTLVVRGACTKVPAHRICRCLAAVLPTAREIVLQGAGHMSPFTHRAEVNRHVADHIAAASISVREPASLALCA